MKIVEGSKMALAFSQPPGFIASSTMHCSASFHAEEIMEFHKTALSLGYDELLVDVTRAVPKLNIDWPIEQQE